MNANRKNKMTFNTIDRLIDEIEKCNDDKCRGCPEYKWFFKPERKVKIMVISESPRPYKKAEIDNDGNCIANGSKCINSRSWIWKLFKNLFGENNFHPAGENATLYWTHYQKCTKTGNNLNTHCKKKFLDNEFELLEKDPKLKTVELIIGIGTTYAGKSICKKFAQFGIKMKKILIDGKNLTLGLKPTTINGKIIAILPHPSGVNRNWNKSDFKEQGTKLINLVKEKILKILLN